MHDLKNTFSSIQQSLSEAVTTISSNIQNLVSHVALYKAIAEDAGVAVTADDVIAFIKHKYPGQDIKMDLFDKLIARMKPKTTEILSNIMTIAIEKEIKLIVGYFIDKWEIKLTVSQAQLAYETFFDESGKPTIPARFDTNYIAINIASTAVLEKAKRMAITVIGNSLRPTGSGFFYNMPKDIIRNHIVPRLYLENDKKIDDDEYSKLINKP